MTDAVKIAARALRDECHEVFGSTWSFDIAERFAKAAIDALIMCPDIPICLCRKTETDLPDMSCNDGDGDCPQIDDLDFWLSQEQGRAYAKGQTIFAPPMPDVIEWRAMWEPDDELCC